MTIRRQYSLPNCTLSLEGLGNAADPAQIGRPSLDILMRFECHLIGQKTLIGGRDLLENLAAAASQSAQEVLSGIQRPDRLALDGKSSLVQLKRIDPNLFRLLVPPELLVDALLPLGGPSEPSDSQSAPLVEMHLSIVQVFDLVEAFDQLLADTQTLPDLSLKFSSLPKREAAARQPVVQQAAPVALGATSLGLAGAALFFLPVPEVRRPQSPAPQPTPPSQSDAERSPSPLIPTPNPEPSSPSPQSSLVAPLASALMITDRQQLAQLNQQLHTQIAQAWKTKPTFHQDLIYRVGVDQRGQIVGYRPMNQAAIDYRQEVPLLDLLDVPVSVGPTEPKLVTQKALAQFRVVFTANGVLQVKPWG